MRTLGFLVLCAATALGALLSATGCYTLGGDCDLNYNCTSGSGGTAGSGGSGGAPAGCVPSNNSSAVEDDCGVFVSSSRGEDMNAGTKDKPFATLAAAFGAAKGKPVYLCGEPLLENVEVNAGALIYGGLDCSSAWEYNAEKPTELGASSDFIPLRVATKTSVEIYDVIVRAADATLPGGSSVAVIAEGESDVKLVRCQLQAGNGASGENGEAFLDDAIAGKPGIAGGNACSANQVITLDAPTNDCDAVQSIGGAGGNGLAAAGGAGTPGLPDAAMNAGAGEGSAMCTAGTPGSAGTSGAPGAGAMSLGAIQAGVGFAGASGAGGKPGGLAQGGGGGGGAKGGTGSGKCTVAGSAGGASGGTGASGGCGGLGGKGGGAGGASIGIISLGATLSFTDVVIATKSGGQGGNGGPGQNGGDGGTGGMGGSKASASALNNGCNGGDGGKGGVGGKGGGGRGGHSIGIAHKGEAIEPKGVTITTETAGNGGTGEGPTGDGAPGVEVQVQAFE